MLFYCCGFLAVSFMSGCATTPSVAQLVELTGPHVKTYEASCSAETMSYPVTIEAPDMSLRCTVTKVDMMGTTVQAGFFDAGEIISREFRKVAEANFRTPVEVEAPVARLQVKIMRTGVRQKRSSIVATSTVRVLIRLVKCKGGDIGYVKEFEECESATWSDVTSIPESFYGAVEKVIEKFLRDWADSDARFTLQQWSVESGGSPGLIVRPKPPLLPELVSIQWSSGSEPGGVHRGLCVVKCGDNEAFNAKSWARAQISEECRGRLGGIDKEHLRVFFDIDDTDPLYDPETKTWTIPFCTFARKEIVFEYNEPYGFVLGDLELMGLRKNLGRASDILHDYVQKEMDRRAGVVVNGKVAGKAHIDFGKEYKVDGVLMQIKFYVHY